MLAAVPGKTIDQIWPAAKKQTATSLRDQIFKRDQILALTW
jgi:hypothetical protein